MENEDRFINALETGAGELCDDCLAPAAGLKRRQANQIGRRLATKGIVARSQGVCGSCHKRKTVSRLIAAADPLPDASTFPVLGIGASAGGLAAFEAFFSGMPADTDPGMAFVLVQHLAPDHKSILTDLIRRYTRMQVFEVEGGMIVRPNCAYIIPPGG